jgi:hypothetical protein
MTDTDTTADNATPTNELEHRHRVLQCVDDLADLSKDISDRVRELRELGVPVADWMPILVSHGSPVVQSLYRQYGAIASSALDGFLDARTAGARTGAEGVMAALMGAATRTASGPSPITAEVEPPEAVVNATDPRCFTFDAVRMKRVIARLFAEAPKMTDGKGVPDPTQAPALTCNVMLKAGGSVQGSLSVTPEGTLRLMSPNVIGQKPVMVEHFFDYEQVADIAIFREVKTSEGSRIVTS